MERVNQVWEYPSKVSRKHIAVLETGHTSKQTHRHADRYTGRQAGRHADRHADRQID